MSIFKKYKDFEFDKNRDKIFGIKSGIIWGHHTNKNAIIPLVYISKPRHLSEKDFNEILDKIKIGFKL